MPKDLSKLKQLLDSQENFPGPYIHKFIGRNTGAFDDALKRLETRFPELSRQSDRKSKGDAHRAMTYVLQAKSSDHVIELFHATGEIEDLLIIL